MLDKNDVVLAKIAIIKKCVATIEQIQAAELEQWMREDLTVLNLQRAIQAAIDLAHNVIAGYGFDLPRDYGQSFDILAEQRVIDRETAKIMKKMVGFRNISVYEYRAVKGEVVQSIIDHHLDDFERYYSELHQFVFAGKG